MSTDDSDTDLTRRQALQGAGGAAASAAVFPLSHNPDDGGGGLLSKLFGGDADIVVTDADGNVIVEDPDEFRFDGSAVKAIEEVGHPEDTIVRITLEGGSGGGAFEDTDGDGVAELQDAHTDFQGGDVRQTGNLNDAIVAYPGQKSIQEAFNEATEGDTIIIAGSHTENSISIPTTLRLDVYWWGSVENTATDGSHAFLYPDQSGAVQHRWINPTIIGNASSGDAIHCPGNTDNQPNQFALFNPTIKKHGGYGLNYHGAVLAGVIGVYGHSEIASNGQGQTNPTNIHISGSTTTTIIKGIHFSSADTTAGRQIEFTGGQHVNPYIGQVTDNGSDIPLWLEGWYHGNIEGPIWFENTNTSDIHWGVGADTDNGMYGRPSIQSGEVKWNAGVEFDGTRSNQALLFEDQHVSLSSNETKTREALYTLSTPRLSADPPNGLHKRAYYYIRTDLSPSELRVAMGQDLIGDTTLISTLGTF